MLVVVFVLLVVVFVHSLGGAMRIVPNTFSWTVEIFVFYELLYSRVVGMRHYRVKVVTLEG